MQLEDPADRSTAYLILRDLYNGEVIHWPLGGDHPLHYVFAALEERGWIARWDRMWPRRDRYRLTETGIATIEAAYRPAGAEQLFDELRGRGLPAAERRAYLEERGLDPMLWAVLHDPSTRWDGYRTDGSRWLDYLLDRQPAAKPRKPAQGRPTSGLRPAPTETRRDDRMRDPDRDVMMVVPYVVDLDREASSASYDGSYDGSHDEQDRDVS